MRQGKQQPDRTHVDVMARQMVGDILGDAQGPVWLLDLLNNGEQGTGYGVRGISELQRHYPAIDSYLCMHVNVLVHIRSTSYYNTNCM